MKQYASQYNYAMIALSKCIDRELNSSLNAFVIQSNFTKCTYFINNLNEETLLSFL